MDVEKKHRLRVENCIGTIIDVQKSVSQCYENSAFVSHFEKLKKAVEDLDMSLVTEGDIRMVEQATNALLKEFRELFKGSEVGPVYEETWN